MAVAAWDTGLGLTGRRGLGYTCVTLMPQIGQTPKSAALKRLGGQKAPGKMGFRQIEPWSKHPPFKCLGVESSRRQVALTP